MLIQGVRRRDPDARLLLIPVGLNALANWINDALWAILTAGHTRIEPYWNFWNNTFSWPFPFGLYDLSIAILLLAIMAIVVLRFARSRREEDQMKSEREAARAVQQVLIPEENPQRSPDSHRSRLQTCRRGRRRLLPDPPHRRQAAC